MTTQDLLPDNPLNDPGLFEYGHLFWENRLSIAKSLFIVSILSMAMSLIMPKTYQAAAVLMPPSSENSASGLLSSLTSFPLGGLLSQSADETTSFIAILKSRTVMEDVVRKFDLIDLYESENIEDAVLALNNNVMFTVEDEGTIRIAATVSTSWFHPDEEEEVAKTLSANIANYFVEKLDMVGKRLKSQQASFRRQFIEKRYYQNIADMTVAEENLKEFQQKYKLIALPEQTSAAIEAAALIKGQILSNEVKLAVMATTLTPGHPEMEMVIKENDELKSQLNLMDHGAKKDHSIENMLFPTFSEVPDLGVKLLRLKRDVEIQNTLFGFMTQQYEEAKIQEAKDTPTVQVLDEAVSPIRKYRPRRMLLVVSIFLVTFLVHISYIAAKANQKEAA